MGMISLSPSFEHREKEKLEKDLNKYYYACGCDAAAKGLMIFLILGIIYNVISVLTDQMNISNALAITVGGAIIGGLIGKLIGITSANGKLKKTIYTIQAYWKPASIQLKEKIFCG